MRHLLTLMADPQKQPLTTDNVSRWAAQLPGETYVDWLSQDRAADIFFDGDLAAAQTRLTPTLLQAPFDFGFQLAAERVKKLLVADMDSTIIQCECIDELADFAGLKDKISRITEAAMQGKLDFVAALKERVGLLAGMDAALLDQVYAERVRLMPGATSLIQTMNARGAQTVLVSGGFTFFTEKVATATGFQVHRANRLAIAGGRLTGEIIPPVVDSQTKYDSLTEFTRQAGLLETETMAVGDGANDMLMIKAAGLGIAYHGKPALCAVADISLCHTDLTSLLYLQGYRDRDFVITEERG